MKKKKLTCILLSISMLALSLTGCGQKSAPAQESAPAAESQQASEGGKEEASASGAAEGESSSEGKTVVQFWHALSGTNGELIDQLVADFNSSQDAVEVVATYQGNYAEAAAKAEQAIFAGNAPDVLLVAQDNVGRLAANGIFEDLLPYMEKDGIDDGDFVEAFVQDAYYDGTLVDVPFGRSAQILHINKSILDEVGCDIPTTWDELKDVVLKCAVVEGGETSRYGLSIGFDQWQLFALVQQAGGHFFNEDVTGLGCIEDGTAKEAFTFLKELQDAGALYYGDPANDQSSSLFTSGTAAMLIGSSGAITSFTNSREGDFDYVTAPLVKGRIASMPTGGCGFGILAASQNKDAAWEFVKWYIQDEKGGLAFVLGSGYLPFTKSMTESDAIQDLWNGNENYKIAYDALADGDDSYRIANLTPVITEFRSCIQAIMLDGQDIDESLSTFSDAVDVILGE